MTVDPNRTLGPGDVAPDCRVSDGVRLSDLRGKPVILAFAPDAWNPAHVHESEIFAQLSRQFGADATFIDVADDPWHSVDSRGELATRFGITTRRALVLLDENGVLRWKVDIDPGRGIRTGEILSALENLQTGHAAPGGPLPTAGLSRRAFLTATLAAAALLTLPRAEAETPPATGPATRSDDDAIDPTGTVPVTLRVNGEARHLRLEPRVALLDALRESLHLTGTKKGCDHGQCGACTVHVNGQSTLSCLRLAVMSQGREITTIEGIASGETLHPLQEAFIRHDAFQCGYCTPGQIMTATALLKDKRVRSDAEIREAMSGTLCRCAAYPNIIAAIKDVQGA